VTDIPPPPGSPPPGSPPPGGPPPAGPAGPDAGQALSYGWAKFQQNVGPFIAVVLIPIAVQFVLWFIGFSLVRGVFGIVVFGVIGVVLSLSLQIGIYNAALMVTRGEPVDIGKAFSTDRWGEWIGFAFVFGLLVGVGYIFCGIGALIVLAFFGLAPFYFLDQRKGLGEALSASLDKTRSTSGLPLAIGLTALVGWAGTLLCGVGALVTMPLAYTGVAFLYRKVNGEPVAP
jgi:hypothetical protein